MYLELEEFSQREHGLCNKRPSQETTLPEISVEVIFFQEGYEDDIFSKSL